MKGQDFAPMIRDVHVPTMQLIESLSEAIDLIDSRIANHHKRVAYIALQLAAGLGLSIEERYDLLLAALLHDIGGLSQKERLNTLEFEFNEPGRHGALGYRLLKQFPPFASMARVVRYHHAPWQAQEQNDEEIPLGSRILHLADRIDSLIDKNSNVLGQVQFISQRIREFSGTMFAPQLVRIYFELAEKEYFWLNAISPSYHQIWASSNSYMALFELNLTNLEGLAKLFAQVVDFRNRFTATHSSGVAACAEALACWTGFSEQECRMMKVAGYFHDLGKITVPESILLKPGPLTRGEYDIIRGHTFYTYKILSTIEGLEQITNWAAFHHERLDGKGYPFHLKQKELPLGARIMAVADVFTAITEDRPYRNGMNMEAVLKTLQFMVDEQILDGMVVSLLKVNFEAMNEIRKRAQAMAVLEYTEFWNGFMEEELKSSIVPEPFNGKMPV